MKILIAVDGSEGSENAVNAIAANPLSPGTEVRVLSVIESPYVPTPETWALPETYFTEMEKAAQEQAQSAVNAACGRLAAAHGTNATISMSVVNGHPKEAILDEAEKWMADRSSSDRTAIEAGNDFFSDQSRRQSRLMPTAPLRSSDGVKLGQSRSTWL